jgi:hypothetical protein
VSAQFKIRTATSIAAACACIALAVWRGIDVVHSLARGEEHALLAYPLTVIFPAVLIAILLLMPPTESREGLLMRVGTVVQLLLIVAFSAFALHLLLGLPVVFLVVEMFETRLPHALRDRLARLVVG